MIYKKQNGIPLRLKIYPKCKKGRDIIKTQISGETEWILLNLLTKE